MSRLFIAEKSSLAQAVIAVLPGTPQRQGIATQVGDDYFVPLAGHVLEQAMPDAYLPDNLPRTRNGSKVWRAQDLPIVPQRWILNPREDTQRNLEAIKALLPKVGEVVNLGDPDAEGQLLVDEVLLFLGNRKPVRRLLVNDYNASKVREALANMRDNEEPQFRGWYQWALARSHCDWLFGLNITRAATLRARELGFDGVLPVGSVQTPATKIVVDRDRAIESFEPVAHFTIEARLQHANGAFAARWQAKDNQAGLDEEGRLIYGAIARGLAGMLPGQAAVITSYEKAEKPEAPPLPLSLNELTVAACRKFGFTAKEVLDAAQQLYEVLKVTSYPRTEVRYLSEAQHGDAPEILAALVHNLPGMTPLIAKANPALKSAAFNDKKVEGTSHHGIVPTVAKADLSSLSLLERSIYDLIVRSYLAQFFPHAIFLKTKVNVECVDETLTASGKTPVSAGWREVYAPADEETPGGGEAGENGATASDSQTLPAMAQGDAARCEAAELQEKLTKAPARFDEASLMAAMIDLQKYTTDPAAKARLKAGKGIGTSATRAGIIKELRERGFLVPVKGSKTKLESSPVARELIDALPSPVKDPTMAGMFKIALDAVATGEITYAQFIERNVGFITKVVQGMRTATMRLPQAATVLCPKCQGGQLRRIKKADGAFWGCSNYQAEPKCAATFPDAGGQPDFAVKAKPKRFGFKKG
ncbi:DNA topoisomerase [Cupriavidus sp. CP313]